MPNPDSGAGHDSVMATLRAAVTGQYDIVRELGRGGAATVYLARDVRHGRDVAVKVMASDAVAVGGSERFLHEIRTAARLTHPHILGVHDSGEAAGLLYYVMPYVNGESLRDRLTRDGALPVGEAVRLIRELADALAHAHAQGIVHRDLKPENVLLSGGHAVIADFGIAKAMAGGVRDGSGGLTGTGVAIGTPAYMAPEQVVGDKNVDQRADLYALGVVAYEMLAGTHPFGARSAQALVAAHLTETPAPLAGRQAQVPQALGALVMRLLAKEPSARPQDAAAVVRALDGMPTSAAPAASGPTSGARGITLAIALVALVAIGYGAWRLVAARAAANAIHTLAVMPFENTGGDASDDSFSAGMTDELAHALTRLPGLSVAGHVTTFALKGKSLTPQEIGSKLDVAAVVNGTVRRAGERLRVTAQLVSTRDGKVLWDSVYESRSRDVFGVQDEFTKAIAATLARSLGDRPAGARAVVGRGTASEAAYELFLKGRGFYLARGEPNVLQSIGYFRQAIAADPTFARAHAALSLAYTVLGNYVSDPRDTLPPLIRASAERAMALDSALADAQLAYAGSEAIGLKFESSLVHYRRALDIDPASGDVRLAYGFQLLTSGNGDDAIRELREAVRLDPLVPSAHAALSLAYLFARRYPEAIAESQALIARLPQFPLGYYSLAVALVMRGHADSAVRVMERTVAAGVTASETRKYLMFSYAAAGRWGDVERERAALRRPGGDASGGSDAAFADLLVGDPEPIVRLLSTDGGLRHVATHAQLGCNPLIDPLWSDPRFVALMRGVGIPACAAARPWPFVRRK